MFVYQKHPLFYKNSYLQGISNLQKKKLFLSFMSTIASMRGHTVCNSHTGIAILHRYLYVTYQICSTCRYLVHVVSFQIANTLRMRCIARNKGSSWIIVATNISFNYYSYGMCIVERIIRTCKKLHVHLILSAYRYIVPTRTYIRRVELEHHAKAVMEIYEQDRELFKSTLPLNN